MQGFKHDQQIIRNNKQMLNDKFERYILEQKGKNQGIDVHWTEENNIHWPLKTKEEYDNLNKLLEIEKIRQDFVYNISIKCQFSVILCSPHY